MKLLVVMADSKPFSTVAPFLAAEDMHTTYARTFIEAVSKIQAEPFDVILISWNLPLIDVIKTYDFLSTRLAGLVVVFSELDKPRILKQLVDSRIAQSLFPPLSGPGVIKRLQQLFRQRGEAREAQNENLGIITVGGSEIPTDIEWKASDGGSGTETLWQGVSASDSSTTYVYQGTAAPQFDAGNKAWGGTGAKFLKVTKDARDLMGSVLGQPIRKQAKKVQVIGGASDAKKYQLPTVTGVDGSNYFYEALSGCVELIGGTLGDPADCDAELDRAIVSWIRKPPLHGLLITGNADPRHGVTLIDALHLELRNLEEENGQKMTALLEKAMVGIPNTSLYQWLSRKTKYCYGVKAKDFRSVMGYLPLDKDAEYNPDSTGTYIQVEVQDALRTGAKLPCDIYMLMKLNQKIVRYISKGTVITEANVTKLVNNQITTILVPAKELDQFLMYKAKYYLGLSK